MRVKIVKITKGVDDLIRVNIEYPGAEANTAFVFKTLPREIALEFFEATPKDQMDKMRGAP